MISEGKHPVLAIFVALAVLACVIPAGANAQSSGIQELLNRVDRLQRELTTLQQQVYQGKKPSKESGSSSSALPASPRLVARQTIRISQLENEISQLTGRLEEINFGMRRIEERLDKLVIDLDQRLAALESGNAGANVINPGQRSSVPTNSELEIKPVEQKVRPKLALPSPPPPRASMPGVLGTIPKNLAVTLPRGPGKVPAGQPPLAPKPKSPLPPGTPQTQYDYSLSLLLKEQDFARAELALKAFVKQYPRENLAGNAQYWLGETYYVRKRYEDAAFAFAEGYQKYPAGVKAPDSLLKLGMSLSRMQKRSEACTAFSRFLSNYPKASARLKARINRERSQAKCR